MIFPAPTAEEERAEVLHERVRKLKKRGVFTESEASSLFALWPLRWRMQGPLLATVFFVLTTIGIVAVNGLAALFGEAMRGPLVLVGCLVAAELLIRRLNVFSTGVETALVIGGLVSFISWLPSEGKPEALLVFALAAALTSWRVHSAIFGAAATLLVVSYVGVKADRDLIALFGATLAVVIICAALLIAVRTRPWIERLLIFSMIPAIPLAYVMALVFRWGKDAPWWLLPLLGFSAVALIAVGLAARHHAHLIAGMIALVAAGAEGWDRLPGDHAARFIVAGLVLLGGSMLIGRVLRERSSGIVATPLQLTPHDEAMNLVVAAAVGSAQHHHEPVPADPAPVGGGGSMGGGGATGSF
jgi:hypothetical protein